MSIAVIVGNGFLFDFLQQMSIPFDDWHPQNPTTWPDQARAADGRPLLEHLPRFSRFVSQCRSDRSISDFEIFDRIVRREAPDANFYDEGNDDWTTEDRQILTEIEARHFLVQSLSHAQVHLVRQRSIRNWRWTNWLREHQRNISVIASFNYDLLLEDTLRAARIAFRRIPLREERDGIPIHKPHGSIDYVMAANVIHGITPTYPIEHVLFRNDVPIQRVEHLLEPRLDVEIVLPAEASSMRTYQWVHAGDVVWRNRIAQATDIVLVGLSYWRCDQDELNALTRSAPRNCRIHFCNPHPSIVWIEEFRQSVGYENIIHQADGPPEI